MSPRRNWDSPNSSLASECALPPRTGVAHSLTGEGLGESQFRRQEKKLSTLPTLCSRGFMKRSPCIKRPCVVYCNGLFRTADYTHMYDTRGRQIETILYRQCSVDFRKVVRVWGSRLCFCIYIVIFASRKDIEENPGYIQLNPTPYKLV